jgi:hypothetical protein
VGPEVYITLRALFEKYNKTKYEYRIRYGSEYLFRAFSGALELTRASAGP